MADEQKKSAFLMTDDQLKALIAGVVEQVRGPAVGPATSPLSPDDQVNAMVDQMRGTRPPHEITEVKCTSVETKASFTAIIAKSKTFPGGRVIDLRDYTYPEGHEVHVAEGGIVPDGLTIRRPDGQPTKEYKHWKWTNFYQMDLRRYVGQDAAWLKRMADIAAATSTPVSAAAV
jgi:hypothetical protein